MSLESSLQNLDGTLTSQIRTNEELQRGINELIQQASETNQTLRALFEVSSNSNLQSSEAIKQIANQSGRIIPSVEAFAAAANQTQQSVTELGQLIQLMQTQLLQQNESLKLQNEAIQTQIKLASESSRSGWIQNGFFFFLGVLIPVIVQLVFKFISNSQ